MKKYQRRTHSDWQSLVTKQIDSGLSVPTFCKTHDISYASLISWKKKLSDADAIENSPATFVEITPPDSDSPTPPLSESIVLAQPCIELDIGASMQLRVYTR